MTLTRFLKLVFLAIGVLYVAVSSLGQALAGTIPMADGHLCTMTVPEDRMCPMPVGEHLFAWKESFRATVPRSITLLNIPQAAAMPVFGSAVLRRVSLVLNSLRTLNGPPGIRSLFSVLVTAGAHQRLTYG